MGGGAVGVLGADLDRRCRNIVGLLSLADVGVVSSGEESRSSRDFLPGAEKSKDSCWAVSSTGDRANTGTVPLGDIIAVSWKSTTVAIHWRN
jgi:hypothetical protein